MGFEGSVNVEVDALGIAEAIVSSAKTAQNREGFVKNLSETGFFQGGQQYNVMVFNLSQGYTKNFNNGIKTYFSAVYDGVIYGTWIFEDGEFTNEGDGGYINWAFQGWFERTGDQGHHVIFRKP
ncbi:hypothetical protein [Nostoc sp. UHCC 0252]|uniref:hypothetical protein n=1 Tax=Nostoc sp. UHCC 0252 TaxID=3110241 RepID=UPI002B218869|nr:hypothetical protein [Nostoc sp. UHCC 0252]MEA5603976.1 hypothetical protein [Nostoc sp. UHCC 0252]